LALKKINSTYDCFLYLCRYKQDNHFIPSPYKTVTEYENRFIKEWNDNMAEAFVGVLKYMAQLTKQTITKSELPDYTMRKGFM